MKKILIILLLSNNVYAGLKGLTHGERANCGVNESVSWDATKEWPMYVETFHYDAKSRWLKCKESSERKISKFHNVSHWGESYPGIDNYGVLGRHWVYNPKGIGEYMIAELYVTDCHQYDGWWPDEIKGENENESVN